MGAVYGVRDSLVLTWVRHQGMSSLDVNQQVSTTVTSTVNKYYEQLLPTSQIPTLSVSTTLRALQQVRSYLKPCL